MTRYRLLGLSGSLREGATNTRLLDEAARLFGDAEYTRADIRFPLYDADDEAATGIPQAVDKVVDQIAAADAVLISTPEYNKGPSGVLKNALDWISRPKGNPWQDKPVAIMSAAAGRAGGERAQSVLRGFMVPFRPLILQGPELHLAASSGAFGDDGHLKGEMYVNDLTALMAALKVQIDRSGSR